MKQYLDLMQRILKEGASKEDRTERNSFSFWSSNRFDLSKGFPMVTTKKLHLRSIIHELYGFLKATITLSILMTIKLPFGMNGR